MDKCCIIVSFILIFLSYVFDLIVGPDVTYQIVLYAIGCFGGDDK